MRRLDMATAAALVVLAAGCQSDMARKAAAGPRSPDFSCYRHIYNTSNQPWTFSASNNLGNLYFNGVPASWPCIAKNGPCTIPPGTTVGIQYTTTGGFSQGTISITDWREVTNSFDYSSSLIQCPYIHHSGNTGSVSVNDPANGDMQSWGDTWN